MADLQALIDAGMSPLDAASLAADFQRAFRKPPGRLVAIALSSDADDTGGHNIAALADFHLK